MNKTLYVGLDVHKDTIAVAVAEDGRGGEIRFHGTIVNSADAVLRLTKTLTAKGNMPSFCYEAGPCGYGIHRHLTRLGFECAVVSPSMIVGVPYIRPAAGTSFCVAADAPPKHKFAGSAGRMTIRDRHRPCPQSDHQQLSSGTVPPMFVFARAGLTRPGADAIPAPRAGAATDETGAAGFKCPLGVMPSAPCSSWTVCAR